MRKSTKMLWLGRFIQQLGHNEWLLFWKSSLLILDSWFLILDSWFLILDSWCAWGYMVCLTPIISVTFHLSRKCPRHVLDMSSGLGHVLKSKGQNRMANHFLKNFLSHVSAACPWSQSRVLSSTWNQKRNSQINQFSQICIWKINSIPMCNISFLNSCFGIQHQY